MKSKIFILFLLVIIVFASSLSQAANKLEKNLVLYLSFDELDGKKVEDHSIHGNHGEVSGKHTLVDG